MFDVIGGDPGREIAKKNGKAHSVDILLRRMDVRHFKERIPICQLDGIREAGRMQTEWGGGLDSIEAIEGLPPRGAVARPTGLKGATMVLCAHG